MDFSELVVKELTEMKNLGLHVPSKAIEMASNPEIIREYDNMKVSEAADLLIQLASLG